jgi:hypothetical protein
MGGAYTVSKENLRVNGSLLAAAALMVDYVLNVAVGISAGVAALVSAIPSLHAYTLQLCLAILAFMTLMTTGHARCRAAVCIAYLHVCGMLSAAARSGLL